jgi:septation ring formation regulator EzrA
LRDASAAARNENEPLLQALDEVFQQLKTAESWLDSCHAVAGGMSRISEAVVSSEYAAAHEDSTGIAIAQRVQELSASLVEIFVRLQAVRQELIQLRDTGKIVRGVAATVVAHLADLDGRLANLSGRLETFAAKVTQTKASVDALHQRLRWWVAFAVVALTVLLGWFGISQIGMIGRGWRLVHDDLPSATAR